jgi:hypothetical protein
VLLRDSPRIADVADAGTRKLYGLPAEGFVSCVEGGGGRDINQHTISTRSVSSHVSAVLIVYVQNSASISELLLMSGHVVASRSWVIRNMRIASGQRGRACR